MAVANVPPRVSHSDPTEVLRRLDLVVRRRLDGLLHGEYMGLVPGHGTEQGETRLYSPGDDVRRIDWNVTARMTDPHVRETIADRELECWVLADDSPSLDFGTALCEKRDLAVSAAAAVGFLTHRTGNRLGAILAGPTGHQIVPARGGKDHLMAVLHRLVSAARHPTGTTDLGGALDKLGGVARRRGLIVVVSDFLEDPEQWRQPLARLGVRHEVLCIEIVDPREVELPSVGVLSLVDPRSGELFEIQTANPKIRERYAAAAAAQRGAIADAIRAGGSDHLQLRTDRDWLLDIVRFVSQRRERTRDIAPRTTA
ncbi:DUF58 domain-containing protein [Iamia sp. SCSIO 61187]|uniref:DUF58 domain-containing protein n=1 Tax=Iamia sp. SCSIO 61187 TaxID=2722752 RepID=UPI001C630BE9|nr:DUF58 domain-containing protein [Iamia sp. SCSIO 61187]QYG92065.1 DUF58 domain-containing protein [Iamia sp. SCSIO 61187]